MKSKLLIFCALFLILLFASCRKEASSEPEENRLTKVVLAQGLNEPLELAILPDGSVLLLERIQFPSQKNESNNE